MKKYFVTILSIVLLLSGAVAAAQTITGSVRGMVTDPKGAIVAGAKVTATNVDTNVASHAVSDTSGLYNFQFLNLGNYTVTVSAPGFDTSSIGPFRLQIDQIAQIDAKLQLGKAATTVNVEASEGAILNTENATLGISLSAHALESMPLPSENVLYATLFTPGALNPTISSMNTAFRNTTQDDQPSFNGNRQTGNNFVLDGIEINETINNLPGYNPAPQSLQEVRTITGNSDAEYGNVAGGEVLMVTKAGTNQFHGSAYEFYENANFQADSFANHWSSTPQAAFTQNLFGGAVGGPIFKNKLFFFGDYEGLRLNIPGTGEVSVPTPLEALGNFSEAHTVDGNGIFNTTGGTNTEFEYDTGGVLDQLPAVVGSSAGIVNPVARFLFAHPALMPICAGPGGGTSSSPNCHSPNPFTVNSGNYRVPQTSQNINNQWDGRVDYTLGSRDKFMIKGTYGSAWSGPSSEIIPILFLSLFKAPFAMGVVDWIHTFSPSLVNEFRPGYSRVVEINSTTDPSGAFGTTGDAQMGIGYPGIQPQPGFTYMLLYGSDTGSFGTPPTAGANEIDNNFDYGDDVTWVHGTHITRMGAQFVRYQENYVQPSNLGGENGTLSYYADYTANYNGNGSTNTCCGSTAQYSNGDGLGDWELDNAETAQLAGATGAFGARQWRDAIYFQDDWKVRPNLTVNLGLRYAYDQPMYEAHNKMASIDIVAARFAPLAPTSSGTYSPANDPYVELAGAYNTTTGKTNSRALINPYYKQFMPRIGFAWQVKPRIVVRGGYGITDDDEGTGNGLRMTQNPPFLTSVTDLQHGPQATSSVWIPVATGLTSGTSNGPLSPQYDVWDPHFRPASVQQFNVTAQYLLASQTSLQVGYVGQLGQHIAEPRLLNQYTRPVPTLGSGGCPLTDTTGCLDIVAPYYAVVGGYSQIVDTVSESTDNYNALQVTLQQHEKNGLEYTVNYTLSRAMSDVAGQFNNTDGVGAAGGFPFPQDSYHPHADYGYNNFDARHNFSATAVYQLPFGRDKQFGSNWNRLTDEAIGGWELSANAILHTGFPATIIYTGYNTGLNAASDNSNYNYAGRMNEYFPIKVVGRNQLHWWGTDPSNKYCAAGQTINSLGAACAYGLPAAGQFGTEKNGSERNPGYRSYDVSLFKGFRTVGNQYFKFRVDAFNVFNIASWGAPNSRAASGNYQKIENTASGPRQIQISGVYTF